MKAGGGLERCRRRSFFFFQAEDGIRDLTVTGVQTCALPIWRGAVWLALKALGLGPGSRLAMPAYHCGSEVEAARLAGVEVVFYRVLPTLRAEIGRASCRERG